jgi:hypothetical protein
MNNFSFLIDAIKEDGKTINICRVLFKDECIAFVKEKDDISFQNDVVEYVKTYGYMAEHRRQWLNGNKINWSDDLYIDVN